VSVSDLTLLLQQAASGDARSQERVLDLLYGELHKMAQIALRGERAEHTLQATALVHEAYLRLFGTHQVEWQSRQHFFVTASAAFWWIMRANTTRKNEAGLPRA
jgi:hypothetical protein